MADQSGHSLLEREIRNMWVLVRQVTPSAALAHCIFSIRGERLP
ncbi:hypothetical protein [Nocardia macrotermitis]|nr:hypothetical protein [Nocardia macrotermitis]